MGAMTTAQFERLDEGEAKSVLRWRFEQLVDAGYAAHDASVLALDVEVDLHAAIELLRRSCPAETALRILL